MPADNTDTTQTFTNQTDTTQQPVNIDNYDPNLALALGGIDKNESLNIGTINTDGAIKVTGSDGDLHTDTINATGMLVLGGGLLI